jgi:hypothetical protein
MVWEPFVIALVFGLLVSAALYFVLLWPGREPPDAEAEAEHEALRTRGPASMADESRPGERIA